MYQLVLTKQNNQFQLKLNRSNSTIRTWFGSFAYIIYKKLVLNNNQSTSKTIDLKNNQIHSLFTEVTCLYQTLIYQKKVDTDLIKCEFPNKYFMIAESLLLQIRLNTNHPSYDDLQTYFLDEFKHFDFRLFNDTVNLLIGKNLIQSIITDDGQQFFDKNPKPHDHIYLKHQQKLIDCTKEISRIFSSTSLSPQLETKQSNIFYLNRSSLE